VQTDPCKRVIVMASQHPMPSNILSLYVPAVRCSFDFVFQFVLKICISQQTSFVGRNRQRAKATAVSFLHGLLEISISRQ
jgi:hypothetical protein